jgi:hypothetical protein
MRSDVGGCTCSGRRHAKICYRIRGKMAYLKTRHVGFRDSIFTYVARYASVGRIADVVQVEQQGAAVTERCPVA